MNRQKVDEALKSFENVSILVVGDLLLDEYLWGETDRISPEAPVPIVDVSRQELRLGGAGNVVNNLSTLGCRVRIASVLGMDQDGETIAGLLKNDSVDDSGLISLSDRTTSRKTRILATGQQMLRVDHESLDEIDAQTQSKLINYIDETLPQVGAVIVSDYGKGVLTPAFLHALVRSAREQNVPVLVDPKGADFSRYRGATLITPNRKEAQLAAGRTVTSEQELVDLGQEMRRELELEALVITRSDEGMSLFDGDEVSHLATEAREVFDVSGAGDTVISVLAAAIAAGMSLKEGVMLANLAGGVVVGKVGTSTVQPAEIAAATARRHMDVDVKIKHREALAELLTAERAEGRKVVFTNGCFDLLHVGHVKYLQAARRLGDLLVLGLNSDDSIRRLKGESRPLIDQDERAHVLAALNCIDHIVIFDEDTPLQLIEALRPDILVKGGDYTPEGVVGRELVESYGGKIELIQFVDGKSTTNIINRILEAYQD